MEHEGLLVKKMQVLSTGKELKFMLGYEGRNTGAFVCICECVLLHFQDKTLLTSMKIT